MQYLLLVASTLVWEANAQEAISVSGGSVASAFGSITYSLGQPVYGSPGGSTIYLGVIHGLQLNIETSSPNHWEIKVFPNPATDYLTLSMKNPRTIRVQVMDVQGRIILDRVYKQDTYTLDISHLRAGTYLVYASIGTESKQFKFIKN